MTTAARPTFLARLIARLQRWADAGWSGSVVFGWGLLQGCIFPGLVDLFFLPLALARPEKAYRLALFAIAGTVLGSVLLYVVGAQALHLVQGPLATLLGMSPERFDSVRDTLASYGGWAIFASTMSPISTKLTSIASGAAGVPFLSFLAFLTVGRSVRAFGIAWIVRNGGASWMRRVLGVQETAGDDTDTQELQQRPADRTRAAGTAQETGRSERERDSQQEVKSRDSQQ